jgi:hypothetical protein
MVTVRLREQREHRDAGSLRIAEEDVDSRPTETTRRQDRPDRRGVGAQ